MRIILQYDNFLILDFIFDSSNKLKEVIYHDVISKNFDTSIMKFDQTRYNMKCCNNTCKWRLHASQLQLTCTGKFVIQAFVSKYTCIGVEYLATNKLSLI